MTFFGLTLYGCQNSIRECSLQSQADPARRARQLGFEALPPLHERLLREERSLVPADQVSRYGPGPEGSIAELRKLGRQHIRCPKAPNQLYRYPLTTNQNYGFWNKDIFKTESWLRVPRYPVIRSEMSLFVENMKKSHKGFIMF